MTGLPKKKFPHAQNNLAHLYERGLGVEKNFRNAFVLYHKAAMNGLAEAQTSLGSIFYKARDFKHSLFWFRNAEKQGSRDAKYILGLMYASGRGVPIDLVQAYIWFSQAASDGVREAAPLREKILERLSEREIALADRRLRALRGGSQPKSVTADPCAFEKPSPVRPPHHEDSFEERAARKLAREQVKWIVEETGWMKSRPAPTVLFVTEKALNQMFYGAYALPKIYDIKALYNKPLQLVYLPQSWSPYNIFDQATLLHELVHHIQTLNVIKYPCAQARDKTAFELQFKWLRTIKGVVDPKKAMSLDELSYFSLTECDRSLLGSTPN